jgi:hypothetical protein
VCVCVCVCVRVCVRVCVCVCVLHIKCERKEIYLVGKELPIHGVRIVGRITVTHCTTLDLSVIVVLVRVTTVLASWYSGCHHDFIKLIMWSSHRIIVIPSCSDHNVHVVFSLSHDVLTLGRIAFFAFFSFLLILLFPLLFFFLSSGDCVCVCVFVCVCVYVCV